MYVGQLIKKRWIESQVIPLRYRPTNSEFVDMLAYYLIQTELDAEDAIEEAKKNLTACQNPVDVFEKISELQNPM